jgi:hypothetical protein
MRASLTMTTDELRKDMRDKIHEILKQVKITNGRVSSLESWRDQVAGGIKILLAILAFLAFVIQIGWVSVSI